MSYIASSSLEALLITTRHRITQEQHWAVLTATDSVLVLDLRVTVVSIVQLCSEWAVSFISWQWVSEQSSQWVREIREVERERVRVSAQWPSGVCVFISWWRCVWLVTVTLVDVLWCSQQHGTNIWLRERWKESNMVSNSDLTHSHTLTYTYTVTHTVEYLMVHTDTYTLTHTLTNTLSHTHRLPHTHTHTLSHTHTHSHTHSHTLTHTHIHTRTHTYTHTHSLHVILYDCPIILIIKYSTVAHYCM